MFKHIPVLGAIFPAAAALWFVHPNSATATVAGVSGAAALAEVKLKAVAAEHRKRKAAKAEAKAQATHEREVREFMAQEQPTALPPARGATIDYTAPANARSLKRLG